MKSSLKRTLALVLALMLTIPLFSLAEDPEQSILPGPDVVIEALDIPEGDEMGDVQLDLELDEQIDAAIELPDAGPIEVLGTEEPGETVEGDLEADAQKGALANNAGETVSVRYIDAKGKDQGEKTCNKLKPGNENRNMGDGWYAVTESISYDAGITVFGKANLILCDGATLTDTDGIWVQEKASLTIWAQSTGNQMGRITADGGEDKAGIGGTKGKNAGSITINGGFIAATGSGGAGIGGGMKGGGGNITINGGWIEATGNDGGAGIGGGWEGNSGAVTINGGTVIAKSNGDRYGGAGIGGGYKADCGNITINDGAVTATGAILTGDEGGHSGRPSRVGYAASNKTVSIGGGAGIGGGYEGNLMGAVSIKGGTVNAKGGYYAAGIGGGFEGNALKGRVDITGGKVTATAGRKAAGIGGGHEGTYGEGGEGSNVTISGAAEVFANSGEGRSSAIGHGEADPKLTYQVKGDLHYGDSLTGELTRDKGEKPGSYPIRIGTLTAGKNYHIDFTGANLVIKARKATPTVKPTTKPTTKPTATPTAKPTPKPTEKPAEKPEADYTLLARMTTQP